MITIFEATNFYHGNVVSEWPVLLSHPLVSNFDVAREADVLAFKSKFDPS